MRTASASESVAETINTHAEQQVLKLLGSESSTEVEANPANPQQAIIEASPRRPGQTGITAQSVRLRDIPGLAQVSTVVRLNQPEINLSDFSITGEAIRAIAPGGRARPRLFTASTEGKLVGFAEFRAALPDRRWHAIALGTMTGLNDAELVEDALLRHAVSAAGSRGVKRLYARVPSGTGIVNSFCKVGFSPFATETIFFAEEVAQQGQPISVRRQEQADTWAIHQLYNATVPRQVQYAEALTSHRWDLSSAEELARGSNRSGWLVDDGHAVAAYGRITRGRRAQTIELLYLPDRQEVLCGLIDALLNQVRSHIGSGAAYCVLRGYQAEAAKELERRSFEPVLEQDLLVKYTTATARAAQFEPIPLHAEVIERLPKRVPSFLHQKPGDEAAS
jgi:hypothetical protein